MNSQRSPFQVIWKSSIIVLLVLLTFQSFGINGLAAPATPSLNYQEGDNPQLACSTSPTPLQFCDFQIVLLIDDSGSMARNDPQGFRNQGAKNLIDFLVEQYYLPAKEYLKTVNSEDEPPVIKIAVVHFTTKVEYFSDWAQVDSEDQDGLEKLDDDIFWHHPVEQNTDFMGPFQKAAELLKAENRQATDEGCTKRLILLFTDGTPQNGGFIDPKKYMPRLKSVVDGIPLDLSVEIYVTGFKVRNDYWDPYAPYWSEIAKPDDEGPSGSVLLGEDKRNNQDEDPLTLLGERMDMIAAHSVGVQSADLELISEDPPTYTIEIPEYIQTLRLTLYDLNREAGLVITDPDGKEITADSENVNLSGQDTSIEVWQLETPSAGEYKITSSQRGGIVTAFLTFQNLGVKVDSEASQLQVSKPGDIKFKFVDSSGNDVLSNDTSSYKLKELNVFVTQGTQIVKEPLTHKQDGDSYQVSWTPESSEPVQLDVEATLVSTEGNTLVNCAGVVEMPVDPNQSTTPPSLHVTPPTSCVSPDQTITLPVQLDYEGDRTWADTLDWNVSVDGQDINATVTAIDASKGDYELSIDPIKDNGVEEIQLTVSAEAFIDGQTVIISDGTITTINVCSIPPTPCGCVGGFPIWLIFVWLNMWLLLLLLGWTILRDKTINLKFWLLVILEIVLAVVWFVLFSGYLIYLFWMMLLIILLIILVYVFRKVIKEISWWLIILVTLFVSIWFVIFGGLPIWLIVLLLLMWLAFLILIWVFKMPEPPSWRWWLLVLLLILALVSIIYFSAYWIYLLLWLLTILILTLVILVIGPICPPIPPAPPSDLTEIEGIGPKVKELLNDHGVYTFRELAETDIKVLNDWLNENDWDYMDPKTWPLQAVLADAANIYKGAYQDIFELYRTELKAGIAPDEWGESEDTRRPPEEGTEDEEDHE